MISFFINLVMYLVMFLILIKYFDGKMNIYSFMIILFDLNVFLAFIYLDMSFIYGILWILLSVVFYHFFLMLSKKGEDIILIKDGNLNFHEIIKNYSLSKLILYLKLRHIRLDEIAYCIKNNNHLTIIKNKEINGFPVSLIVDGVLLEENLKLIAKKKEWLQEELLKKHLLIKNINYAYYKKNKVYFVND